MTFLILLVVTLGVISCGSPTCIGHTYGLSVEPRVHFATVTVYSEPLEEPLEGLDETGVGLWERFERSDKMTVYAKGGMAVSDGTWPERCPRIPQEDLAEASQHWQHFLEHLPRDRASSLQVMVNPYTGDDWRADGPLLSLQFGSASGKSFGLLWDYRLSLPKDLDTAVIATLELVCSNSRLAQKYLRQGLPQQVGNRLECSTD